MTNASAASAPQTGDIPERREACVALGGCCEWPMTCMDRNSCAYTSGAAPFTEAELLAGDVSNNEGKAARRERENEQRAMGLQLQHLDVMRRAGVL